METKEKHLQGIKVWVELARVRVAEGLLDVALLNLRYANGVADHILNDHKEV